MLGYQHFFVYVMICSAIPILLVALVHPKLERNDLGELNISNQK
jgi:hypothetical protein